MIGDKIRDLRNRKRMSQTELAKVLHVSQQTVTKWETGKAEPSSSAISSLSRYFNVSADYLLGTNRTSENDIDSDLDKAIDNAMSFDGRPVSDHDRKMMKQLWKAYIENKD